MVISKLPEAASANNTAESSFEKTLLITIRAIIITKATIPVVISVFFILIFSD
jgi:hypothetical protein